MKQEVRSVNKRYEVKERPRLICGKKVYGKGKEEKGVKKEVCGKK